MYRRSRGSSPLSGSKKADDGNDVDRLLRQLAELTDNMFAEGILDDQFTQLQQLQDESNPEFVGEVIGLFFEDSEKLLAELSHEMRQEPLDFSKIDAHVHQFKGASSSVGAARVKALCMRMRTHCDDENKMMCMRDLERVKEEFNVVKVKLEHMLALEQKILKLGGYLPFMAS